jgi:hypothetical protein
MEELAASCFGAMHAATASDAMRWCGVPCTDAACSKSAEWRRQVAIAVEWMPTTTVVSFRAGMYHVSGWCLFVDTSWIAQHARRAPTNKYSASPLRKAAYSPVWMHHNRRQARLGVIAQHRTATCQLNPARPSTPPPSLKPAVLDASGHCEFAWVNVQLREDRYLPMYMRFKGHSLGYVFY